MKKLVFLALLLLSANTVQAQIESDVEIVRSDVRTQKMQILTKAMEFTSDEAAAGNNVRCRWKSGSSSIR